MMDEFSNPTTQSGAAARVEAVEAIQVTFTNDQLAALDSLLDLVHFDELATSWYELLPVSLRSELEERFKFNK